MKSNKPHLPIFGVGPIYILSCFALTTLGLILDYKGFLELGKASQISLLFVALGIFMIIFGLYLWVRAVLIQKINANVKADILITDGVYAIVRNPVYTTFIFIFTGILLFAKNYFLLISPIIF